MKVVIVGSGAMGCLYAGMLCRTGIEVWLLDKLEERVNTINKRGLLTEEDDGQSHVSFNTITTDPKKIGKADVVIIFVKAYDTAPAINAVLPCVSEKTIVLTLQNGLGNVEKICSVFPDNCVLGGTTAHGSTLLGYGHVRHSGVGETVIGAIEKRVGFKGAQIIKQLFADAGIDTTIAKDIHSVLWGKLLINIGINPLTAIIKIKNGQLLNYPCLLDILNGAVTEGFVVAKKMGITIPFSDPSEKVKNVCAATSKNYSSMLQDILAHRKTEIEYINGAVVEYGEKALVPTPVNRILVGIVRSIENSGLSQK